MTTAREEPKGGLLTLDELARLVEGGEIDTVLVVFTDHYGRFMGKRFDAELLPRGSVAATARTPATTCSPSTWRWSRCRATGFANWERGYGDVHLVPDLGTLRVASWLDKTRARALRRARREDRTRRSPSRRARSCAARSTRAAGAGLRRHGGLGARVLPLPRLATATRARKGYRDLEPAGWYLEDYHMLQGTHARSLQRARCAGTSSARGVPVEISQGRVGPRPARAQRALRRGARDGRPPRVFKQCLKEIADAQGLSVTFMAKFAADRRRLELPHPPEPLARRRRTLSRRRRARTVACSRRLPLVPRRLDRARARVMAFYAPTVNSYKRYVGRLLGADAARLEPRQPHRRLPRRRRGPEPAHRVPHPRRRLQPLPRLRRGARLGPRRHREPDRAAADVRGRRLRGGGPAAVPDDALREATEAFEQSDVRARGVRRGRRRALRALLPHRAAGASTRP